MAAVHTDAGYEPPTRAAGVRETLKGVRRVHGAPAVGKAAAVTADVRRMVEALPDSLIGVRDRALLVVGFAGAFRRSELVAVDVENLDEVDQGVIVTIRRSKTDQEDEGREVRIGYARRGGFPPPKLRRSGTF